MSASRVGVWHQYNMVLLQQSRSLDSAVFVASTRDACRPCVPSGFPRTHVRRCICVSKLRTMLTGHPHNNEHNSSQQSGTAITNRNCPAKFALLPRFASPDSEESQLLSAQRHSPKEPLLRKQKQSFCLRNPGGILQRGRHAACRASGIILNGGRSFINLTRLSLDHACSASSLS